MFRKLRDRLDPGYTKICLYAGVTAVLVVAAIMLIYVSGGFWSRLWTIFTAVLRPVVIGGIFCFILAPAVNKLEDAFSGGRRRSWARPAAVALTYLAIVVIIALIVLLVYATVSHNIAAIDFETLRVFVEDTQKSFEAFMASLPSVFSGAGLTAPDLTGVIPAVLSGIKTTVTGIFFGAIFSIYFLLDGKRIGSYFSRAVRMLAGEKTRSKADQLLADTDRVFSGYFRGQLIDAVCVGILSCVVLQIAGVPNALIVGLLTGIGNLIPYVGPIVGFLTLVIACIPSAAWTKLIVGAICLVIILFIDGNVLNPRLLSSSIRIHPLLVIAALIAGSAVGGFVGMVVAVPIAALIKIQFDRWLEEHESGGAPQEKQDAPQEGQESEEASPQEQNE